MGITQNASLPSTETQPHGAHVDPGSVKVDSTTVKMDPDITKGDSANRMAESLHPISLSKNVVTEGTRNKALRITRDILHTETCPSTPKDYSEKVKTHDSFRTSHTGFLTGEDTTLERKSEPDVFQYKENRQQNVSIGSDNTLVVKTFADISKVTAMVIQPESVRQDYLQQELVSDTDTETDTKMPRTKGSESETVSCIPMDITVMQSAKSDSETDTDSEIQTLMESMTQDYPQEEPVSDTNTETDTKIQRTKESDTVISMPMDITVMQSSKSDSETDIDSEMQTFLESRSHSMINTALNTTSMCTTVQKKEYPGCILSANITHKSVGVTQNPTSTQNHTQHPYLKRKVHDRLELYEQTGDEKLQPCIEESEKEEQLSQKNIRNLEGNNISQSNISLLTTKAKTKSYKCIFCDFSAKTQSHLIVHYAIHKRAPQKPYRCVPCGESFTKYSYLLRHTQIHKGLKPYGCVKCKRSFVDVRNFKYHWRKCVCMSECHETTKDITYKCSRCSFSSVLSYDVAAHFQKHIGRTGRQPYECEQCGKFFKGKNDFMSHILSHSAEQSFSCEHCTTVFASDLELKSHTCTSVNTYKSPFQCAICAKGFFDTTKLSNHVGLHLRKPKENLKEKAHLKYLSEYPDQAYREKLKDNLDDQVHLQNSQEYPKEQAHVENLQKTTKENITLENSQSTPEAQVHPKKKPKEQVHLESAKENTEEKPYKCSVCCKQFRWVHRLKEHAVIHRDMNEKEYQHLCEQCGKSFQTRKDLKVHMISHSNEKPHQCEVCGKSFAIPGNLRAHVRIHTGDKPHECSVCKKRFFWPGDLAKHKQTHGDDGIENENSSLMQSQVRMFECKVCLKKFFKESGQQLHYTRVHS